MNGPARPTSATIAAATRMIRAAGRRAGGDDPDTLAALAALHRAVDDALAEAVAGQRSQGVRWESIAQALGVTKQAVVQRWGPSGTSRPTPQ